MAVTALAIVRDQLIERRHKLASVATTVVDGGSDVLRLLAEVDAALQRMDSGTFGLCETCGGAIEPDRLLADPLTRFCLDDLTPAQQRGLQQDLELAARIQRGLLPKPDVRLDEWDVAYHYQPAGPVSGDYCDFIVGPDGDVYFLIGDVEGKGVSAAMLMSHLSAMLRTLISVGLPLCDVMQRVSRVLCESTLPTSYATLVCAQARTTGEVEVCNAGHPPPLVIRRSAVSQIDATGVPIGMFCDERFPSRVVQLDPGDALLLYTDGLVEAQSETGEEYGAGRLLPLAASLTALRPKAIVDACHRDVVKFRGAAAWNDDLTIMAVRRS